MQKIFFFIKLIVVLLFLIFEEVAWNNVAYPIYRRVRAMKLPRLLKSYLEVETNRYKVLAIFIFPFILSKFIAFKGVAYLTSGDILKGLFFYIGQLFLTIPVFFIFTSAKKKLLTFWIVRIVFFLILKFRRTSVFKRSKSYIKFVKAEIRKFREELFGKDGIQKGGLKELYNELKARKF